MTASPRALPTDPILRRFRDRIRAAAQDRTSLQLCGGGSKRFYGGPPQGEPLDVTEWRGMVAYEPTELVFTAKAGTPWRDVTAALAEHGQHAAFDPPLFAGGATVGGVVAAGLAGPARPFCGAVRDAVLGVSLLDGKGDALTFGGQVMKNVAGYDVSRLMTGSLGTLGLITHVSVKVLPQPRHELTATLPCSQAEALKRMLECVRRPQGISGTAWAEELLHLRFSGGAADIAAAKRAFADAMDTDPMHAASFWPALRDHQLPFFMDSPPERIILRAALPAGTPAFDVPEPVFLEWNGMQRWYVITPERISAFRALCTQARGHATLFRTPASLRGRVPIFTPLAPPLARIHARLKAAFDPAGVFNPGRMGEWLTDDETPTNAT